MGLSGAAANAATRTAAPVAKSALTNLAANPGMQTVSMASGGASGGAVREAGGGPTEQFVASLGGSLLGAGMTTLAEKAYDSVKNAIGTIFTPKQNLTEVNIKLENILNKSGMKVTDVPQHVRNDLAKEIKNAMDTGREINPAVVQRIADYGVVGATPTKGTVTLDPVQITQERNLAKLGANSNDPRLQELARVQNSNNAAFIKNLNDLGATANADSRVVGSRVINTIQGQDAAAKAGVDAAYGKARDNLGRASPMDSYGFSTQANLSLDEGMLGHYLPSEVKGILNDVSSGKIPLNVNTAVQIDSVLSKAQRTAGNGSPQALAIGKIRDALNKTNIADNVGEDAKAAFDSARGLAKSRFDWQKSAPGIADALEDANPDRFVNDYILSNSNKAQTANVEKMLFTLKNDPQALKAVKENIVTHFKNKALGNASDEVGNFSQSGYNKALSDFGDAKLKLFFNKDEIAKLKTLGRVSSYEMVQPKGSAVNNSNSASAFASILDKIASNPIVGRIPFAAAAVKEPAQNWSAQIGAKNALTASDAVMLPKVKPKPRWKESAAFSALMFANPRSDD